MFPDPHAPGYQHRQMKMWHWPFASSFVTFTITRLVRYTAYVTWDWSQLPAADMPPPPPLAAYPYKWWWPGSHFAGWDYNHDLALKAGLIHRAHLAFFEWCNESDNFPPEVRCITIECALLHAQDYLYSRLWFWFYEDNWMRSSWL